MLSLVEIPKHGDTVLSARRSEGTVRRNRDSVDIPTVAVVVGLQFELRKLPYLQNSLG